MTPSLAKSPPTVLDSHSVVRALSEIAETAAETLELQEVFDRVATSVRRLIPFDNMGVVRIVDGDRAVLHAATNMCDGRKLECLEPIPLTAWSPRMRPRPGPNPRIDNAPDELDSSYLIDGRALAGGVRSGMWEPFRPSSEFRGGVWLASYAPSAFTDEHQRVLRPIAALIGSAVEHWRIWDADRRRRDRLDRVESVLGTLAGSLDIREVFPQLSADMQPILPHDIMVLTELDPRDRTIRIAAFAGECDTPPLGSTVPLTDEEMAQRADFEILDDLSLRLPPDTDRRRLLLSSGLHSWLRVPVLLSGEVRGGLNFFHREPGIYQTEDAPVARRLADRIALTLSLGRLADVARRAVESRERAERLQATVETLARELERRGKRPIVGVSASWQETLRAVARVAPSETTVLITGESGTGKEVVAGLLHQGSPRAGQPLVAINCAALPEQLLESELFGHEKGAFTGANAAQVGKIEQAAGGTLFLDEVAEMSPLVQAKLLRVLETREFQRLGGTRTLKADVRLIAATNRDLTAAIARQAFREDLYYRLNVFQIHTAPLRERPEDILPLAEAFLEDLGRSMARPAAGISRDGRDWLLAYPWPGNVRELRNAIERALLLCDGGLITREHLPAAPRGGPGGGTTAGGGPASGAGSASGGASGRQDEGRGRSGTGHGSAGGSGPAGGSGTGNGAFDGNGNAGGLAGGVPAVPLPLDGVDLDAMERGYVQKALEQARGNKSQAARLLGLSRAQLYTRLEKHQLR